MPDLAKASTVLAQAKQHALLKALEAMPAEQQQALSAQILALNESYPGGLACYSERARKMLQNSRENVNPFEGLSPFVPVGFVVDDESKETVRLEEEGFKALAHTAFVLVAGGLGQRLGYSGIKVALPVELLTGKCFLQHYIEYLREYQRRFFDGRKVALAIMTSGDTYEDTVKLLAQHANFGLEEGQITLMKQEKVPAMLNSDADFALNPDSGLIDTKPHGHGDVHTLLYQHKLTNRWLAEGIKHVVFFQDTNPLIFRSLPLVLGVSRVNGLKVNSVTVPRKPGEAVGAIMKLKGHREMTINVEYNQLEALLASYGGEAQNEHGYSLYPGNINSLVFELEDYSRVLERTKGSIQEFVNPKYKNKEKTTFKSPTRLECMMQDYPMLLDSSAGVGFTQLERGLCFSAVKNDLPTAQAKFREGLPPECASCCEADLYQLNRRLLSPRVRIQEPKPLELGGMSLPLYPRVYLGPRFGLTRSEVLARVGEGCELAGRCELVVEEDVRLEGLRLNDGERAVVGKEGVAITPARKLAPVQSDDAQIFQIRGYKQI